MCAREESPTVEVARTDERLGWVVLTVRGRCDQPPALELVCQAVIDAMVAGGVNQVVEVSEASPLAPDLWRALVLVARVLDHCRGMLVVSGLRATEVSCVRAFDHDGVVELVSKV